MKPHAATDPADATQGARLVTIPRRQQPEHRLLAEHARIVAGPEHVTLQLNDGETIVLGRHELEDALHLEGA